MERKKRKWIYKITTIMMICILTVGICAAGMADLAVEYGSADNQVETAIQYQEWDAINKGVLADEISASKAEEVLNRGYCLNYMDSWKSAGKIPSDFTPASQKSTTSTSSSTKTDNSTANVVNSEKSTTEEKTYSDEEIVKAWTLVTTVDATCATDGFKEYKNTLTNEKKTETIPATGEHDYQVTDSTDATCTEKGSVTYTCSVCGDTYTEESDFADHDYKEVETKDATCTEDGYAKYECTVCGDSYEDVIKATGHDDGEWTVTKEASFFEKGEKELKCTVCGEVLDTEEIASTCPIPLAGVVIIVIVACGVMAVIVGSIFDRR